MAGGFHAEAYRLAIASDRIEAVAGDARGLRYAALTLMQIIRQRGTELPCLTIDDAPDFARRGFMHDVSRGKVPTLATMRHIVATAAAYKLNEVQFYIEHTFAFPSERAIWEGRDVITPEDIRELDAFARTAEVDLVPNIASFGHMYDILENPAYRHLNELEQFTADPDSVWWDRMTHHTIDVSNEETYRFLGRLLDDYLPLFSSRYVNLNCDETVDLGMGRNVLRAEREGIGELYLGHVNRLAGMVRAHGKTPMIWGDIVVKHPELLDRLPDDIILLNWEYGRSVAPDQTHLFAEKKRTFHNCPGVWGWSKFSARIDYATANISRMARYGREYGASGMLTTDWGDFGHINALGTSRHGLVTGACCAWNASTDPDSPAFDEAVSHVVWEDESGGTAGLLRELGELHTAWRRMIPGIGGLTREDIAQYDLTGTFLARSCRRGNELVIAFDELAGTAPPEHRLDYREFAWAARATVLNGFTTQWAKRRMDGSITAADAQALREYAASMRALASDFAALWRERNRESELGRILAVFESIATEAETLAERAG